MGGAVEQVASPDGADTADPLSVQQTSGSQATAAALPKALPAAYQNPQLNLPHLAFEIARQLQQGSSRFQVRLDPPELGRIDVRMDIDSGGNVNARLTVERSETLDLLQRDQRALERALAQAGLEGAKTNLEFSLKQNPFEHPQGGGFPAQAESAASLGSEDTDAAAPSIVTLYRATASAGGLNILV